MINKKLILGLSVAVLLASCSTTKNIHKVTVPNGSDAVVMSAKKGTMTTEEIQNWPHADITTDSIPGMSLAKAYQFVADKKATTVIVAVIDSGIDINHEDLKDKVWTNSDEVAGNGIDDDKNGYIDDIHGWNFLGGEGTATPEQLEITRMYKKYDTKFGTKTKQEIPKEDLEEYIKFQKLKTDFDKRVLEADQNVAYYEQIKAVVNEADKNVKLKLGKDNYTVEDLQSLDEADKAPILVAIMLEGGTVPEVNEQLDEGLKHYKSQTEVIYNLDINGRTTGDDAYDIKDVPYGNTFTIGSLEDEMHGTHVSGIAVATRNNGIGMNGVAQNVKLLSVRAVPDGDEYDKDVALAIHYAVDNGAKVINMSFGKSYSPNPEWVYDAFRYAESKDVLLVHAAGNDGKNIDKSDNFPTDAPDKVAEITEARLYSKDYFTVQDWSCTFK